MSRLYSPAQILVLQKLFGSHPSTFERALHGVDMTVLDALIAAQMNAMHYTHPALKAEAEQQCVALTRELREGLRSPYERKMWAENEGR